MKKMMLMAAFIAAMTHAHAQKVVEETDLKEKVETAVPEDTGDDGIKRSPSTGDLFDGLTRPITFDRMIPPYALEVTFYKTVHIIFPSAIKYVDLGSADIIAGKADGSENVLRVKAALRDFSRETNLAVITEDGSYYTYNVKYADEPAKLNIEMKDFLHDGEAVNRPNNAMDIYLTELENESPRLVRLIMKSVYRDDKRKIRHIGSKRFGVQFLLKGLYTHGDLLYFHTEVKNGTHVPFDVDFVSFKIVDKKIMKRTAMQEQAVYPLRAYHYITRVDGKKKERSVFALPKFTLPDDKKLVVELAEKQGGRHQEFEVASGDLVRAETINELRVR